MAKFFQSVWQCQCGELGSDEPWACPGCGKECCESCFSEFMHCRECSDREADKAKLAAAANRIYGTTFSEADDDQG